MNSIKFLVLAVSLSALGYFLLGFTVQDKSVDILSLLGLLIFIGSFVWVLLSEMFANKIRSAVILVAIGLKWAGNYAVPQSFTIVTV